MGWWAKFLALFKRKPPPPPHVSPLPGYGPPRPLSIPAPATLVAKVDRLDDEDRDMLRVAEEALRRGFPEEARVAYGKALRFYVGQQQYLKAISVVSALLRLRSDDVDVWIAKAECCVALDRRRDAARAFMEAANIKEGHGDLTAALDLLERCLDLDRDLEGLRFRYQKLGGTRDVWNAAAPEVDPAPELPADPPPDEGPIELPMDPTIPPESMVRPATRPPVRFAIPKDTTVYEPSLPSSIIGTEHEAEASGDMPSSGIADASTQAIDATALSELLKKIKANSS